VLADIMKRVESEAQDDFMMWLFGPGNRPLRRKMQSYPPEGVYSLAHISSLEHHRRETQKIVSLQR
jgi:hypothetical protein